LVVGASFAFLSRAGWTIAAIDEPIVELTGVHFHYAGFATLALAMCVARASGVPRAGATVMLALGIGAPAVVASGFTWRVGALQIAGALLMTAFAWTVAALTLVCVRVDDRRARVLLVVSSLSVVAPMVLAVFWAVAQYFDVPSLSIPMMARIHGTLNA